MEKTIVSEGERIEYTIRHKEGLAIVSKVLYLDKLISEEMDAVSVLIGEMEIVDKGDLIGNAISLNIAMSKNHIYSKLCSIILHDENGKNYPVEFYGSCIREDIMKLAEDFFNGEGGDLLRGVASVVYAPLLKLKEGQ
jgi:hypothetical protein